MMGRREGRQGQFFYSFNLDQVVPADHLVRQIDGVLDLAWVHQELAPYYSHTGRPSIDPVLMIRMLIVGYVFAIRSERRLCAEVQVNLAYRWFLQAGHRRQDSRSFGVLPSEAYYNRICVDPRSCCARAVALGSTCSSAPPVPCSAHPLIMGTAFGDADHYSISPNRAFIDTGLTN